MPTIVIMLVREFRSDHGWSWTYAVSCRCQYGATIEVETTDPWMTIAQHTQDTGKDHTVMFRANPSGVEIDDRRHNTLR